MLIVQPVDSFSDCLCAELESGGYDKHQWSVFEFAVAWINRVGADKIFDSVKAFLYQGKSIRATLGVDFSSTSYEALECLLELEEEGLDINVFIFHDESRLSTFHPKVFLFSNDSHSNLLVGSNNMTGGGMGGNVEVTMGVIRASDDAEVLKVKSLLQKWRDEFSEDRVRRLTRGLLNALLERGYVRTEAEIRRVHCESLRNSHEPLFGKSKALRKDNSPKHSEVISGRVHPEFRRDLLMRVRKRRDGTQLQISMKIYSLLFEKATNFVVSAATGERHDIGYSYKSSGGERRPNTARFEAPELEGIGNPVALFRWVGGSVQVLTYEIYDGDDNGEGARIYKKLQEGIGNPPVTRLEMLSDQITVVSKPNAAIAQWYRLS